VQSCGEFHSALRPNCGRVFRCHISRREELCDVRLQQQNAEGLCVCARLAQYYYYYYTHWRRERAQAYYMIQRGERGGKELPADLRGRQGYITARE
jgi:hypothetical protein